MTQRVLFSSRTVFEICLGFSIVAGLWGIGWYTATPAMYSDLTDYGIEYGDDAHDEIVAITERIVLWISIPLALALVVSMTAWGMQVRRSVPTSPSSPSATSEVSG